MGFTQRAFYFQLIVLPIHILMCYIFIMYLDFGVFGAAIAGVISSFLHLMAMAFMAWTTRGVQEALFWPTRESRTNLMPLIKLSIPSSVTILVECMNWESLAIFSGMIGTNYLAAEVIIINIGYLSLLTSLGFMQGCIILSG